MRTVRKRSEDGAALVEFALIAPLLLLLLLGIIEFGWLFGQYNDVRHGAREGARYASVNGASTAAGIATYTCDAMDLSSSGAVTIDIEADPSDGTASIGDTGTLSVTLDVNSLSNAPIISGFLPEELTSTVSFRLEQTPDWNPLMGATCP